MNRILTALLLVACSATLHAEEQLVATPSTRLGGSICLAGLAQCLPMSDQETVQITWANYWRPITTPNVGHNMINLAINECLSSVSTLPEMALCMGEQGYLVTGYRM